MLKFNISSLVLVFLVHLISNVTGLVELSKRLQDSYTITTVQGVSIATCRLECESRQRCKSAIYHRDVHHCILTSNDTLANSTVVRKGAVLLSGFHSSLDQNGSYSNCGGVTFLPQETCTTQGNGSNQVCKITECPNPRNLLPSYMEVKGNIYTIGSKLLVGCNQNMKTIHCQSNGSWTNTSPSAARDCTDLKGRSGVYTISPNHQVYCDMDTDQGHWLVFQRRMDGSENFSRSWTEYKNGFGDMLGEFWLGLELVNKIVRNGDYELRVDMTLTNGEETSVKYSTFSIGDEVESYRLSLLYSGNYNEIPEELLSRANRRRFSTFDRDSDGLYVNCASDYKGAWWYGLCYTSGTCTCYESNLNGLYGDGVGNETHMRWGEFLRVSGSWTLVKHALRKTEMKIRRKCD